ncbi:hypothetical protein C8R44DRAFT_730611 [Mycena epipterygia]|nr:hypothetical protein C8R44DRAFT_730611 [Mycena epipterygia]
MDVPPELFRSTEFWFDDGTVVLQVENTLYRVYRGLLSSRSTVFHDTFSIPQPVEERTEIEGCPVVQLHDKSEDFTRFLKALHHYGSHKSCSVSGIAELSSVLRLSDKYDVPLLRDSMISIISDLYPTSLDGWLTRRTAVPPGYRATVYDHITVLNIAREMGIRCVLPGVMYLVCQRHDLESIVYGVPGKRHIKIESKEDRKRCMLAIPELIVARRRVLSSYLMRDEEVDGCEDQAACDAERLRWLADDLFSGDTVDPLVAEIAWEDFEFCSSCLEAAQETYTEAREVYVRFKRLNSYIVLLEVHLTSLVPGLRRAAARSFIYLHRFFEHEKTIPVLAAKDISAALVRFPDLGALNFHGLTLFLRMSCLARQSRSGK